MKTRRIATMGVVTLLAALLLCVPSAFAKEGSTSSLAAGMPAPDAQAELTAQATIKPRLNAGTLWAGSEYYTSAIVENAPENAKLVSVKSSNAKVVKPVKTGTKMYDQYLVPLKPGTSKVTVTYKANGKTKSVSGTYRVKKYPSWFKSVELNGKRISVSKNKYFLFLENYKKSTIRAKVTPAKGWHISRIDYLYGDEFKSYTNGTKAKVSKTGPTSIFFIMANNKTNDTFQYGISIAV